MITRSRRSSERGSSRVKLVRSRGFGEVYAAMNKKSNDLVAIKKVRIVVNNNRLENESNLLKKCQSRYTVRYYDVLRQEGYLWVVDSWCV